MAGDNNEPVLVEVRYTANFAANLQSIFEFWDNNGFPEGDDRLLDELIDVVVTNLERHPRMGRPFMSRRPESVEAQTVAERLQARFGANDLLAEVREYVMAEYLVLYTTVSNQHDASAMVHLLAIKHHKQLSFDFERLWTAAP
jgi:hypothetical protein